MAEKNQALIETEADERNQQEIDRLQANEKRPPYELYGVVAVCIVGAILITLVLLFAQGTDRAVYAGIVSTFVLAFGMPLIGKINQSTHDTVNARLGEERREKREAARELKRQNDVNAQLSERLIEMSDLLSHTKSKVARQHRITDEVPVAAALVAEAEKKARAVLATAEQKAREIMKEVEGQLPELSEPEQDHDAT